jgi:hypothetical protein
MPSDDRSPLTRRDFLKAGSGAALGSAAAGVIPVVGPGAVAFADTTAAPIGAPHSSPPGGGPALDVSDRKQLFIDRRFIAAEHNVTLTMNPPQKLGIVLEKSEPWEVGPGGYFRVVEDGPTFKLYYSSYLTDGGKGLCYAESTDGLRWTKPALGLVEVNGSRDNNVIYGDNAVDATVMLDPHDPDPSRRFKMFRSLMADDPARAGVYASYSADGLRFTEAGRVLPMWPETSIIADWDERVGRYVVFLRVFFRDGQNQRRVGRLETDDLLKPWPFTPTEPLRSPPSPENIQQVLATDEAGDGPWCDLYTGGAHIYVEAQDIYLMFPTPFRHFTPQHQPFFRFEPGNDYGMIETQLAVSRDGVAWSRPDRRPYVPPGLPDEWDRWMTMMGVGMVRRGNHLYQYYWSTGRLHDGGVLRPEYDGLVPSRSAIGALRQRLDGFISADFPYGPRDSAAGGGGTLTTPPLVFSGTHLRLNVDTGGMGAAFVELRDPATGAALPGFAAADCEEVGGNFTDAAVRWRGRADLSALAGRPVVMHVAANAAKLYAFQFAGGAVPA